jgi:hypothetical protein
MNPNEIAMAIAKDGRLHASRQTIYNDLTELKTLIAQKIDANQLWAIRRTIALREELIREAWRIYHLEPRMIKVGRDEEAHEEPEDVSWRQLSVIGTVDRLAGSLDRLAFGSKVEVNQVGAMPAESAERIVANFINGLPADLKYGLVAYGRTKLERRNTSS